MVLNRERGEIHHAAFRDLPRWLTPEDLLVVNDTRVFPARLKGVKESGGKVELLLHHLPEVEGDVVGAQRAVPRSAQVSATYRGRLKVGQMLRFGPSLEAEVMALPRPGVAEVRLSSLNGDVRQIVASLGEVPLPPYIRRSPDATDAERYQTIYAAKAGAIACPTAGLHFTPAMMEALKSRGIETVSVTLHVGPGTFAPVRVQDYTRHRLEPEYFELSEDTAARLNQARAQGKRLAAVGTTSVRALEYCASPQGFAARQGWCDLYLYPGYRFKAVDKLLTNFHLPKSTLLLLVSAFAGRDFILRAYEEAIREKYRFYSYGDCMLII
jgi:S-adenosylmethionine:tRNA ribosyltransferase-isomerase